MAEIMRVFPPLYRLVTAARKKEFAGTLERFGGGKLSSLSAGAVVDFIHTEVYIPREQA